MQELPAPKEKQGFTCQGCDKPFSAGEGEPHAAAGRRQRQLELHWVFHTPEGAGTALSYSPKQPELRRCWSSNSVETQTGQRAELGCWGWTESRTQGPGSRAHLAPTADVFLLIKWNNAKSRAQVIKLSCTWPKPVAGTMGWWSRAALSTSCTELCTSSN